MSAPYFRPSHNCTVTPSQHPAIPPSPKPTTDGRSSRCDPILTRLMGKRYLQAFDAAQMRIRGTELEKFLITTKGTKSWKRAAGVEAKTAFTGRGRVSKKGPRNVDEIRVGQAGGAKPSKWRVQSTQFREAIRQVRLPGHGDSFFSL